VATNTAATAVAMATAPVPGEPRVQQRQQQHRHQKQHQHPSRPRPRPPPLRTQPRVRSSCTAVSAASWPRCCSARRPRGARGRPAGRRRGGGGGGGGGRGGAGGGAGGGGRGRERGAALLRRALRLLSARGGRARLLRLRGPCHGDHAGVPAGAAAADGAPPVCAGGRVPGHLCQAVLAADAASAARGRHSRGRR
jgi:hypothetical protein